MTRRRGRRGAGRRGHRSTLWLVGSAVLVLTAGAAADVVARAPGTGVTSEDPAASEPPAYLAPDRPLPREPLVTTTAPVAPPPPPPAPGPPPESGTGQLSVAAGEQPAGVSGRVVTYSVEVEGGLPVEVDAFAAEVHEILTVPEGWESVDGVGFARVADPSQAAVQVTLASPTLTDALCAPLQTRGNVSCWNGERAVINAKRWVLGAATYGADLTGYRQYLIAHEVGHGLGRGHVRCPAPGGPAPVMVQQTKGLDGCVANPFPLLTRG